MKPTLHYLSGGDGASPVSTRRYRSSWKSSREFAISKLHLEARGRVRALLRIGLIVVVCTGVGAWRLQAGEITEQQVKAGFVYNFVRFIEWPDTAIAADQPLKVCLLGKSDVEREMESMMRGKPANGHTIDVSYVRSADEVQGCHVIFVDASERHKVKAGLVAAPGALIIGDFDGFAQQGGTINFVTQNNRISFDINVATAQRAGLKVSSRLLAVAHTVIE